MSEGPPRAFAKWEESQDTGSSGIKQVGREIHREPRGQLFSNGAGTVWRCSGLSQRAGEECATGIQQVEARDAAKNPTVPKGCIPPPKKELPSPNVNSALLQSNLPAMFWNISKGALQTTEVAPQTSPTPVSKKNSLPKSHPTGQCGGMGERRETILGTTNEDVPLVH